MPLRPGWAQGHVVYERPLGASFCREHYIRHARASGSRARKVNKQLMKTNESVRLIGKGRTAEVFTEDTNKVLKLFNYNFWKPAIEYEYMAMKVINELEVHAPKCIDLVKRNNRFGITYERIFGSSLVDLIIKNPLRLKHFAKLLAREHYCIHKYSTNKLRNQKERFEQQILESEKSIGHRFIDLNRSLIENSSLEVLCHGDFHPDNVLMGGNKCYIIDWMNCYTGSREGDIARTYLMLISPYVLESIPKYILPILMLLKRVLAKTYIKEYSKLCKVKNVEIDDWLKIIAAARLSENIPKERDWLMGIILNNNGTSRLALRASGAQK